MDILVALLKYTGAVIAGTYGVYATLTDFRTERNGRKVLSRKGYIGIALLVFSTVLSLSSDGFKDYQEHLRAKIDERKREQLLAEQKSIGSDMTVQLGQSTKMSSDLASALEQLKHSSAKIDSNLKTTVNVLDETRRLLDPLQKLVFTIDLMIPSEQAKVRPYFNRLRSMSADEMFQLGFGQFGSKEALLEGETLPNINQPEEEDMAVLVDSLAVFIGFKRTNEAGFFSKHYATDLLLRVNCEKESTNPTFTRKTWLFYNPEENGEKPPRPGFLTLGCRSSQIDSSNDDSLIRGLRDLKNLEVAVWVNQDYSFGSEPHPRHDDTEINFRLDSISLRTATGRTLMLSGFEKSSCRTFIYRTCYMTRIGNNPLWRP